MFLERLRFRASDFKTPQEWLIDALGSARTASGERVTSKTALSVAVYFACIRNIAEDVAKLPMIVYESETPRGKKRLNDHPLYKLMNNAPNEEMTAYTFRETMTAHALGWKGGFAEVVRRGDGRPALLYPMDPNTVRVGRDPDGNLWYVVQVEGRAKVYLRADEVLHVHGMGFDGVTGYAMAQIAQEAIGAAIGTQRFGAAYFGNGAVTTGYLEVPGVMQTESLKRLRESFAERHQGAKNSHKPIILERGIKFTPNSNDPQKSQMIDSSHFHVEDICRWFRMPPHKVGHLLKAAGWSTLEASNLDYYTDSLWPWLARWEQEIKRRLVLPSEKNVSISHLVAEMLRMDAPGRSAYYTAMYNVGAMSPNDIRDHEDMNPRDGGDVYYVSTNVQPAGMAQEPTDYPAVPAPDDTPGKLPVPPRKPKDPGNPDESGDAPPFSTSEAPQSGTDVVIFAMMAEFEPMLTEAFSRVLQVESDRVSAAAVKPGFIAWLDRFYAGVPDRVRRETGGIFDAFAAAVWSILSHRPAEKALKEAVSGYTVAVSGRHIARSTAEAHDQVKVDGWRTNGRAHEQSRAEAMGIVELVRGLIKGKP